MWERCNEIPDRARAVYPGLVLNVSPASSNAVTLVRCLKISHTGIAPLPWARAPTHWTDWISLLSLSERPISPVSPADRTELVSGAITVSDTQMPHAVHTTCSAASICLWRKCDFKMDCVLFLTTWLVADHSSVPSNISWFDNVIYSKSAHKGPFSVQLSTQSNLQVNQSSFSAT